MLLAAGSRFGAYEIRGSLGAGGMGEVYRAHDPRLGRDVALKRLPESMGKNAEGLARFEREARAVAALNHPHIVAIYSTEESDGVRFMTMELIEGQTLSRLIPEGGVSLSRFFDVSIALADALSAAHAKLITHRDLKPANVMVAENGWVTVLDFGLARGSDKSGSNAIPIEDQQTQQQLTREGTVMGTAPYMSPEQVEGKAVGPQSDLFSLGIMMHEMLAGSRPFRGDSSQALMASILKDLPRPIAELRPEVPEGVSRLVRRCLEKDPRERIQSAQEVLIELRALRGAWETGSRDPHSGVPETQVLPTAAMRASRRRGFAFALAFVLILGVGVIASLRGGAPAADTTATENPSIAVLPFVDMSEAKDQQYFSDGMSEELLNLLAKIPALRVTSRSSAFSFRGKNTAIPEIAKSLNVAHILEGSVRKAGNKLRITAQLIDARSDTHIWSETYDRTLDDVFAVQDEISAAVVTKLKVALLGAMPKARQTDPRAYELWLQSNDVARQSRPDRTERSVALLKEALAIDPNYVAGWTRLASTYANEGMQGTNKARTSAESFALAREAVEKARALDPNYVWVYTTLAQIAIGADGDLEAAARHIEHALTLEPDNADLMLPAATLVQSLGRLNEALALREYAIKSDPLSPFAQFNLGLSYLYVGRLDDAIAACQRSLKISPGRIVAHYVIGLALIARNDGAGALAEMQQETAEGWHEIGLPLAYHALGKKKESDEALATLIEKREKRSAYNIAQAFSYRSENDRAFEWLEKAGTYHDAGLSIASFDPLMKNLHADARWLPFLQKIGKAPEQLAKIRFEVKLPKPGA